MNLNKLNEALDSLKKNLVSEQGDMSRKEQDKIIGELMDSVRSVITGSVIDGLVKKVLANAKVDKDLELRRDHDGVSSADFLVQKLIGEFLTGEKMNW